MSKYDLSLIVTTYNRLDHLTRFLNSIADEKFTCKLQVILINQGILDKNIENLFVSKNWKIINVGKQIPLSEARNLGLRCTEAPIIGFPDDDCWYSELFTAKLIEKFNEFSQYDCICTSVFDPIANEKYGNRPRDLVCNITYGNVTVLPVSVGIFVRKSILKKYSIDFDERLGAGTFLGGGEETAFLCNFLSNKCKIIYFGQLSVFHEVDKYENISLSKVQKYSRGYGYILGSLLKRKKIAIIPPLTIFLLKSFGGLVLKGHNGKYFNMYLTRIKYFFVGMYLAYRSKISIFK